MQDRIKTVKQAERPESDNEFHSKVVLVSSVQNDSALMYLTSDPSKEELVKDIFEKSLDASVVVIAKTDDFLTKNGTIASHLDFENGQYTNTFVDRPHMHWAWNGLVHANRGGDWEAATVGYLEPLSEFRHVYSCAPYDTMTIGHHRLSAKSTIIIPAEFAEELSKRLTDFEGTIVSYNPKEVSLREAINDSLRIHYPAAYRVTNKHKTEVNTIKVSDGNQNFHHEQCSTHDYDNNSGYFKSYYITETVPAKKDENELNDQESVGVQPEVTKPTKRKKVKLLDSPDTVHLDVYQKYTTGRHVGLHHGSSTDIEKDPDFQKLKAISEKPEKISENMHLLVGAQGNKNAASLLIVKTYKKLMQLTKFSQDTGLQKFGDYLIKKALIADIRSIHHEENPSEKLDREQLRNIIETIYSDIFKKIQDLSKSPSQNTLDEYRKALLTGYRIQFPVKQSHTDKQTSAPQQIATIAAPPMIGNSSLGFWNRHRNKIIIGVGATIVTGIIASCYLSKKN